jgi:hypothetical protein
VVQIHPPATNLSTAYEEPKQRFPLYCAETVRIKKLSAVKTLLERLLVTNHSKAVPHGKRYPGSQSRTCKQQLDDKNEVHLCGVLSREPESRYTAGGKLVANFSLCTQAGEHRAFHNCVAWENLAEQITAVKNPPTKKRQRLKIVGRLNTHVWEKDGDKRTSTEIICRQITVEGGHDEN